MIRRPKTFMYLCLWLGLNLLSLPMVGAYLLARYAVMGARDSFYGRKRPTQTQEPMP